MILKIFFILLLLIYHTIYANSTITISHSQQSFKEFQVERYEDNTSKLSFEDIRNVKNFTLISNRINEGYSSSYFWFKFKIKNDTNISMPYIIYFSENLVHELDCYEVSADNSVRKYQQGVGYYIKGQPNKLDNPKFNIVLDKNETKTIYIRMYSKYPNFGAFYLFDKDGFNSYSHLYDSIYSAYFGGMLALLLYNLFLLIFSRDIAYLYYILLVSSYLLWQLSLNNFPPFQTFYSIDAYYLAGTPVNFMIIFIIIFIRKLLSTKEYFPLLDKVILSLVYISILLAIASLFLLYKITPYINILATVTFPFLLYIGFKSYINNNKIAIFFIVAQILFLISSTIFSLMLEGHLAYNIYTRHSIAVGSSIELLLFSLTLAYSIRLLQNEKIDIINGVNIELEERVKERTKDLEESKRVLKELSIKDPMTNLYNRRYLFEVSQKLIAKEIDFSLILLDIDKFKNINDTYGHDVGDKVIVIFANSLLANTREDALVFRIGGEEFLILLHSNIQETLAIAQKIREDVQKITIKLEDEKLLSFTTSGGVTSFQKEDRVIEHTINRADTGLYQAKNSGRNKIIQI